MIYRLGRYRLDTESRVVLDGDAVVRIPPKAVDLLLCLVERQGSVVPKEEIFARVWPNTTVQESSLSQAVLALRRSLRDGFGEEEVVETVPRRGYRLTVAAIPEVAAPTVEMTIAERTIDSVVAPPVASRPRSRRLYWAAGAFVLAIAVLGLARDRVLSFYHPPLRIRPLTGAQEREDDSNISADGKHVVYSWRKPGEAHYSLWIKTIGAGTVRVVQSDGDDRKPVWAPDRPMIAFVRTKDGVSEIHVVAPESELGGDRAIAPATSPDCDLAWSPDGKWLAYGDRAKSTGIRMINLETGAQRQLTSPPVSFFDSQPKFSPDGKTLGFVRNSSVERFSNVYAVPFAGGTLSQVTHVKRNVLGFDWTADGEEIVFGSDILGMVRLFRISVRGNSAPRAIEEAGINSYNPSISRRGGLLTYTQGYIERALYSVPGPGSPQSAGPNSPPLTGEKMKLPGLRVTSAAFSADGKRIAYTSEATGSMEIWVANADGSNPHPITTFTEGAAGSPAWSPDGKFIVYDRVSPSQGVTQLFIIPSEGGTPKQLSMDLSSHTVPTWSPDGQWIYFSSPRSGVREIWRRSVTSDKEEQITHNTGIRARPSPDGKYVYYVHGSVYTNQPAVNVWRAKATGGSEELVAGTTTVANPANYALTARGVYWEGWDSTHTAYVFFMDFATGKTSIVAADGPNYLIGDGGGIAVSPDDKTILLARIGASVQRIMVADGFR